MKQNNGGFSLVETVAAIAILGVFFSAACAGLLLGLRMNEKTDAMLQSQLAVSSAVEMLMHKGIDPSSVTPNADPALDDSYPAPAIVNVKNETVPLDVVVSVKKQSTTVTNDNSTETVVLPYYKVTVTSTDGEISVTTHIREAVTAP